MRGLRAAVLATCLAVVLAHGRVAASAPRDDDLVAPPMSLARLRALLDDSMSPPPTAAELSMAVTLHRDMVAAYGASRQGPAGDIWRTGDSQYTELMSMREDPSRARMKAVIDIQKRMLADAAAAEATMFDGIATLCAADEPDEASKDAVRAAVARARAAREADRLMSSFPLGEPSGVRYGMRDAVARLRLAPEVVAACRPVLAERGEALARLLQGELRDYHAFAIAAAGAFEKVFGGILPPIGAVFSDDEVKRLRSSMRELCTVEGERFLAARRAIRAREDAAVEQLCALVPPESATELRLRLSPSSGSWGKTLVGAEGHVRDALRELPADDPVRAAVAEFAPRWRAALTEALKDERAEMDQREDETFWDPTPWRATLLAFDAGLGADRCAPLRAELDRILAPRVMEAGGKLGSLAAYKLDSGQVRMAERRSMSEARKAAGPAPDPFPQFTDRLTLYEAFPVDESKLSPEYIEAKGIVRRGVIARMRRAELEAGAVRGLAEADATIVRECIEAEWAAFDTRWDAEVEGPLGQLAEARRVLNGFHAPFYLDPHNRAGVTLPDERERIAALNHACVLRDTAWRAAEACEQSFFDGLAQCASARGAKDQVGAVQQAIALERLRRFIERERRTCFGNGFSLKVEPYPQWAAMADDAGLDEAALARVRRTIVERAPGFAAETIGIRVATFDQSAAQDASRLGLRDTPLYRSKARAIADMTPARLRAVRAASDMLAAMFDAAADGPDGDAQRALLESAALRALYQGWGIDPVAQRTARRAEEAATSDEERAAVRQVMENYERACAECNERAARLAVAWSSLALGSNGRVLFELPAAAAEAGSPSRLSMRLERELRDLRDSLEIELLGVLGRERWQAIAEPDEFELHGVGGRG